MKQPRNEGNLLVTALAVAGAGTLLAVYILLGFFAAKWLQNVAGGPGYYLAIGSITGLIAGIVNVVVLIMKFMGDQDE